MQDNVSFDTHNLWWWLFHFISRALDIELDGFFSIIVNALSDANANALHFIYTKAPLV